MTNPSNDPLAAILSEAERNRRLDRAASASASTVATSASVGDYTVDSSASGTNAGNVVVLDGNGKIPPALLYPASPSTVAGPVSYDHTQASASTTWTIPHMLGGYPPHPVILISGDGTNTAVNTEVQYPDDNHMVLKFGRAYAGVAHLTL